MARRRKLTKEQMEQILNNEVAIWHFGIAEGMKKPIQIVFPGQAVLHDYPGHKSYFTVPNSPDKFYIKEYDYFWWICPKEPAPKA